MFRKFHFLLVAAMVALITHTASASERMDVCARYETESGWSKNYHVQATLIEGSELNDSTKSWRFDSGAHYAVIFWQQHEASVIKLEGGPISGGLGAISGHGDYGKDQGDRRWSLAPYRAINPYPCD